MEKDQFVNIISIFHNEKNQILAIKNITDSIDNYYLSLPCVSANFKERIEDTLKREINEKLSLIIEPLAILGVYSDFKVNKDDEQVVLISIVFVCLIIDYLTEKEKVQHKKALEKKNEKEKRQWIDIEDIAKYDFAIGHKMIIEDYLKWRNHNGTFWSSKLR